MGVRVQEADFNLGAEVAGLTAGNHDIGAIVTFTGTVRGTGTAGGTGGLKSMTLEHYPGMTEAALEKIEAQARARWPLAACLVIHRYGTLAPGDNIVAVVTASPHRKAAFEAAEFLMDYLKTEAPFWKREEGRDGAKWVDAREADTAARDKWASR
ncbi:Molybdopterin synthase catalytic subunit MoaE [hydrothermal vent metagenome]|uniref:Molybdopterin synthase catalytic subunit MoaE n=1 Tax=hydrothermal vent metagenome TaxID=652676 RepID=A0A3B0T698_9ZZZZ